jgi:hypothetical protein
MRLDPKKLGLLRELVPHATEVGALLNPAVADFQNRLDQITTADVRPSATISESTRRTNGNVSAA